MPTPSKSDLDAHVKSLYYVMQSIENKLGGGEGIEGLYGSLTRTGMAKVLHSLSKTCGLNQTSRLLDVGAGLGRPLLHALISPGVKSGYGIEIDQIKCSKAHAFMRQCAAGLHQRGIVAKDMVVPVVKCSAIEKVGTLYPATHAYSFWEGVPIDAKCAFGRLFAASKTMQGVAVVQRAMRGADPAEVMAELGFGGLHLQASFAVSMSGSGRSFTAYVFSKAQHAQQAQRDPLSDVTAAQPVSPQPIAAPRAVAESPSPPPSAEARGAGEKSTASRKQQAGRAVICVQAHCGILIDTARQRPETAGVSSSCTGAAKAAKAGLVQQPAVRQRAGTCRSKQRADVQSKAVTAVPVRRSQRQLQQRQVREQQQQDKIQHNVTVNAQVSDTIALLASPVPSTERPSAECAASPGVDGDFVAVLRQTNQGSCYRPSAHQQASEQEQHQQQLQVQQQCVKPSKPVCAMTGTSSKGKVHSPTGVKKQVSPISKGVSKGLGLGARFPLRVRKNLDQLQAKQVSNNEQGYVQLNRGLADVARSVGC